MSITLFDAWTLRRLLTGHAPNGELQTVSRPFRQVADHLAGLPEDARRGAWDGFLAGQDDRDEIIVALADVDPLGPPPEVETEADGRCATLADVLRLMTDDQWAWRGWLALGVLNALAADPGTGKTIIALYLAFRLWFGLSWPDGQPATLPERTRTLWVPGDRHYTQLTSLTKNFGLPNEAVLLNAPPSDPTSGLDMDDPTELDALARRIRVERPGMVIVDTVGQTTGKNLCKPEDARGYFGPLMDLALDTRIPFLLLTHLSKDGNALGRRISGACRLVWKMTNPDPDGQPNRRRVWVDKSYAERPPALGMTISESACDFDVNPPSPPEVSKGGRPSDERGKAERFIRDALTVQNDRIGNELRAEWEKAGGHEKTFWRAVDAMEVSGVLTTEGGKGTGKQKLLHLIRPEAGTIDPSKDGTKPSVF